MSNLSGTQENTAATHRNTDDSGLKLDTFSMIYNEFWPLPSEGAPEYPGAVDKLAYGRPCLLQ